MTVELGLLCFHFTAKRGSKAYVKSTWSWVLRSDKTDLYSYWLYETKIGAEKAARKYAECFKLEIINKE